MSNTKSGWKKLTSMRLFLPIVCLIAVLLVNVITTPGFFKVSINNGVLYGYIVDVINRASELVILAVGMTLVTAASGGQDISVGAVMAVAAAVCCQILSGGEVSVNSLSARGIAQLITDGQITYIRVGSYKVYGGYIGKCPVPTPIFIAIIVVVITYLVLKKTALGLYIESVGINGTASRLVGLNSTMIKFLTYVICGVLAGIAGIVASSRIYSADANNIGLNLPGSCSWW